MKLALISSPFALDQFQKSAGLTPQALLAAGLASLLESDGHTVSVAERPLDLGSGNRLARIGRNSALIAEAVAAARRAGALPVVLGGDCMVAVGVVAGLRQTLTQDLGIAWFDAHGDFNTPATTISGYLGGMPLAACCGRGLETLRAAAGLAQPAAEAQVAVLGVRDLDPAEQALLDTTPVQRFGPAEIAAFTAAARPTYLHFDIDCLDLALAPGVNYPAPNGLSLEAALAAGRQVRPHLAALALTAIDPERDPEGKTIQTGLALLRGLLAQS